MYIDSLDKDIICIHLTNQNLTFIPDLSRFKKLKKLICFGNELTSLPELPSSLEVLECYNNKLFSLPKLPSTLKVLECCNNNLTSLPALPFTLEKLCCDRNKLTYLPALPPNLQILWCCFNKLTYLPNIPNELRQVAWHSNPIYSILFYNRFIPFKDNINTLNRFRFTYYALHFKKRFMRAYLRSKRMNYIRLLEGTVCPDFNATIDDFGYNYLFNDNICKEIVSFA
jgi:Leucine-rich repeat (LRR) protein